LEDQPSFGSFGIVGSFGMAGKDGNVGNVGREGNPEAAEAAGAAGPAPGRAGRPGKLGSDGREADLSSTATVVAAAAGAEAALLAGAISAMPGIEFNLDSRIDKTISRRCTLRETVESFSSQRQENLFRKSVVCVTKLFTSMRVLFTGIGSKVRRFRLRWSIACKSGTVRYTNGKSSASQSLKCSLRESKRQETPKGKGGKHMHGFTTYAVAVALVSPLSPSVSFYTAAFWLQVSCSLSLIS